MTNQPWKYFAERNAPLRLQQTEGQLLNLNAGLRAGGFLAHVAVKSCAPLVALALALSLVSIPSTTAAAAEPPQELPQDQKTTNQRQAAATGLPTEVEHESWRKTILHTPRPKLGCFTATFPEIEWRGLPAKRRPANSIPQSVPGRSGRRQLEERAGIFRW